MIDLARLVSAESRLDLIVHSAVGHLCYSDWFSSKMFSR